MCKKILGIFVALAFVFNICSLPVKAEECVVMYTEPRYNNISRVTLTIGFDSNNMGYFGIYITPYARCTGFSGQMRLYDENGNLLAGWAIYDEISPYEAERTYQCQEGKTYTVTFQGYAYSDGSAMYDDIDLSISDICD